ncbi:MAG: SpoIIE family protein phosphatase [Clostridiales bacterium]|nr:SpoIIE family protein phosphatase [Clostridiales bacterium]
MTLPERLQGQRTSPAMYVAILFAAITGLAVVRSVFGYLMFHSVVEIFSIAVAAGMFMITWNLRRFFDAGYLLVLSVGFFVAACVDTLHTFSYPGIGILPDATANLPTQLWLIARYLEAAALVVAPAFAIRKADAARVLGGFGFAGAALLATVFVFDVFPAAFIPGTGLTPFKIWSEYAIIATMGLGLVAVHRHRFAFQREVYVLLSAAIIAAIASEMAFTLHADPYGTWNLIGHLLKVATFFLLYRAVVETALVRPFDVLFGDLKTLTHDLSESEARFRTTFERATVGIAHIDMQGEWIRYNQRLAAIAGYEPDELAHHRPDDITHPQDRAEERLLIEGLTAGDIDEYQVEKRLITRDGSTVWVEASRTLLRGDDGAPRYFIATLERIDARKERETELRRSRDLTEAVNRIDTLISATTDVGEIAQISAEEGANALGAESAVFMTVHRHTWSIAHLYRFPGHPDGVEGPWSAIDGADIVASPDTFSDDRFDRALTRRWNVRAVLAVPLALRGEVLGVIYFVYHSAPHRFSDSELEFARKLGVSIALAIDTSRTFESQRAIADALQSALLYMPDNVPGLEIAHVYRSATELTRIGGDFYDVFDVARDVVAFVLGDVSGKGLEASTLTAMAKSTIRAFAYQDHRPAHVLEAANSAISSQIDDSRFITAVYGTIDMTTGTLRVACAGHPPPLVCVDRFCVEHHIERFPPLGVLAATTYTEHEITLSENTIVVLYSDGLIEARNGASFFGEERVARVIEDVAAQGVQGVVDTLVREVETHSGGQTRDDVAIVAMRYLGRK